MAEAFRRSQGAWEVTTSEVSFMRCVKFGKFEEDWGHSESGLASMSCMFTGLLLKHK